MLNVANDAFMLRVVMLNGVMLNVVILSVVMISVVAPKKFGGGGTDTG
jgi:hypothetical protein